MVVTSKHRTHKVMETAIRELMGAGTPPSFKFKDTHASIEFPSGYTIPSQATLEAKYDELLALEEDIQKTVMEGDLEVGTSNLFVDTQTGNIGIGTTDPSLNLHVMGGIKTQNNGVLTPQIQFGSGANNTNGWLVRANVSDTYAGEFSIDRQDNSTTPNKFVIKNNGNVGIGTNNPFGKLQVDIADASAATATWDATKVVFGDITNGNSQGLGFGVSTNSHASIISLAPGVAWRGLGYYSAWHKWYINNVEKMVLDASGKVGIGTTSPSHPLTIQETTTNTNTVTYPLAIRAISSGTVANGFGAGIRFQCERRDTDDYQSLAGSVEVYGAGNLPGTSDLWNMRFGVRYNDTAVTPMTLRYDGNVGIGTNNPLSTLEVGDGTSSTSGDAPGSISVSGTGATKSNGGKPGVYHRANIGLGLWSDAQMSFEVNGYQGNQTEAMRITTAGNVGIGVVDPKNKLDVRSDNYATFGKATYNAAGWSGIRLGTPYATNHDAYCSVIESYNNHASDYNSDLRFKTSNGNNASGNERMRITSAGNVGIGTASPGSLLTIESTSGNQMRLNYNADWYNIIERDSAGDLNFLEKAGSSASLVNLMTIKTGGNVGIGTPSPGFKLHVVGTSYFTNTINIQPSSTGGGQNLFTGYRTVDSYGRAQLVLSSGYSDVIIASSQVNNNHGSNLSFVTYNPSNSGDYRKFVINQGNWGSRKQFLDFGYADKADPNPHAYINSTDTVLTLDGYNKLVGIGTTSPVAKLTVNAYGSENSTSCLIIGANTGSQNLRIGCNSSSNYCWIQSHQGKPLRLNPAGNSIQYGTSNTTLSDDRIKDNEVYIENATDTLLKLKPQVYDKKLIWNISKLGETSNVNVVRESGLITQDVWYDAPELRHLVHLGEGAEPGEDKPVTDNDPTIDPDYTSWGDNVSLIEYTGLIPYLIKSNQEIYTELQTEKTKVADLLARVEALENA